MQQRVEIGKHFDAQSRWKRRVGVLFVYIPLLITVPFVLVGILSIKVHLKMIGAQGVKPLRAFVPSWSSHRYTYGSQIVYEDKEKWNILESYRFFWIFNCKIYCPLSVALFRYMAYLVRIVENWWCPFSHDKKAAYRDSSIDYSYWHIDAAKSAKLHEDDRENPIWNQDAPKV